jgi:hypothetical protein
MKTFARIRFLPLLALVLAAGCGDLGLDPGGGQVVGLTIEDAGGNTLVSVASGGTVSGSITVPRNGTRSIRVVLRGASGVVTPGIGESIRVTVINSSLVAWDETGEGTGVLDAGAAAGSTSLRVDLISGGTALYTSPSITVQVT